MVGYPDLENGYIAGQSFGSASQTATANGNGVDFKDAEGPVHAVLDLGAVSGTTPTLDVTLEESDDDSVYTAIAGSPAFAQKTDGEADTVSVISTFNRSKRYVRAVATIAGTTPDFQMAVDLLSATKSVN